jgi:hypothetical protein
LCGGIVGRNRLGAGTAGKDRGYGDSLFDRLGLGFTLLRLGRTATDSAVEAAAQRRNLPLKVVNLPQADVRELYGGDLALIGRNSTSPGIATARPQTRTN